MTQFERARTLLLGKAYCPSRLHHNRWLSPANAAPAVAITYPKLQTAVRPFRPPVWDSESENARNRNPNCPRTLIRRHRRLFKADDNSMLKRLFDIVGALFGLILFAPVFFLFLGLIRSQMGAPVFFRQNRPGQYGRPFEMLKFRTMLDATGPDGQPLPDAERLTALGRKLRSSSLDELPELWNVLKGDMSLVGPRPLLMEYLPLYSKEQARRHEVKPGITGWAQVNGRNAISWEEKFALDVWYVDNRTLLLDLKIIWLTIRKVLARDGINADGEATMPKFTGSK